MARLNPSQPVHAQIAERYLRSARKLGRLRPPAATLHALEHAVAAAEHAQYSHDQRLLDESVRVASELQDRVLASMGSGREMLAVPMAWTNPTKAIDTSNENEVMHYVSRAQGGDRKAFGALYSAYYDRMFRAALQCVRAGRKGGASVGDIQDAKDLTQNAFLKAMQKLGKFEGKSKFSTWLYRVVRNECKDWSRRLGRGAPVKQRERLKEELRMLEAEVGPGGLAVSLGAKRIARAVASAMDKLPESRRNLIVMADMQAMSLPEVAQAIGASDRHVVAERLLDARKDLQQRIHKGLRPDISISPAKVMEMSKPEQEEALAALRAEQELLVEEAKKLEAANKALRTALGKKPKGNPRGRAGQALRRRLGLR